MHTRTSTRSRAIAVLLGLGSLLLFIAAPTVADARRGPDWNEGRTCDGFRDSRLDIVGLTADGRLVCFREHRPDRARDLGVVTGLENEQLVGIDFRVPFTDAAGVANGVPPTGTLYGLGRNGGVYTIDTKSAVATKKAQLDVVLQGNSFGVDFNPTVDRLRIVSDTGQNLRANVVTGATLTDTTLNVAGAPALGVTAAGYTNNDTDPATATTLYDLDTTLDQLLIQTPPNAGALTPVGALGVDAGPRAGLDLYSVTARAGAVTTTVDVRGFAALNVGGTVGLYEITPFSGRAVFRGSFGSEVVDLAIPLAQ
jgi:hypothetical protein